MSESRGRRGGFRGRGRGGQYYRRTENQGPESKRETLKGYDPRNPNSIYSWFPQGAKLEEGKNFTQERLRYMTPFVRAEEITDLILQEMGDIRPIFIVETCGGIGGNTLSFWRRPRSDIHGVITFEVNPEAFEMLHSNLEAYSIPLKEINKRIYEVNFTGNLLNTDAMDMDSMFLGGSGGYSAYSGSVLYMDPPWLEKEVSENVADPNPSQYIKRKMKLGTRTLEEWIEKYKNFFSLIVLRLPVDYELENVSGVRYIRKFVPAPPKPPKSLVVLCVTEVRPAARTLTTQLKAQAASLVGKGWYDGPKHQTEESKEDVEVAVDRLSYFESKQWLEDLKKYLDITLLPWMGMAGTGEASDAEKINIARRAAFLDPQFDIIWIRAFTHASFDPVINYDDQEIYETLGDAFLKAAFVQFLKQRFGSSMDTHDATILYNYYTSKKYLPLLATAIQLDQHVRVKYVGVSADIKEDIFESYLGAFTTISAMIEPTQTLISLANFVNVVFGSQQDFKSLESALTRAQLADPITIVNQTFEILRLGRVTGKSKLIYDETGAKHVFTLYITPAAKEYFSNEDNAKCRELTNDIIGQAADSDKTRARLRAYENARHKLFACNINWAYLRRVKETQDLYTIRGMEKYRRDALNKLERLGYSRFVFTKVKGETEGNRKIVSLIGIPKATAANPAPMGVKLAEAIGASERDAKIEAVRKFVST